MNALRSPVLGSSTRTLSGRGEPATPATHRSVGTPPAAPLARPNSGRPDARIPLPRPRLPGAPKHPASPSLPGAARSRRASPPAGLRLRVRLPLGSAPLTFLLRLLFLLLLFGGAAAAVARRRRRQRD